jgi:Putative adhesin
MQMKKTHKVAVAVAAGVAVAATVAGAAIAAKSDDSSHARFGGPIHRVVVDAGASDVRITAGGRSDVDMTRKTNWLFSKPKVEQFVRDGVLHLTSHSKHGLLSETDWTVLTPRGVAVSVETSVGNVRIKGAPGNVSVDTDAGYLRVDVKRAPHRIDLEADAGDIDVTVPRGEYAVKTHTDAGDVSVRGVVRYDRAAHSIDASTDAGDITIETR